MSQSQSALIGKFVVVRTYSAGVHVGILDSQNGKEVTLTGARRIWSWKGANTLNEIANKGVGKGSNVSESVAMISLTEAIEVIVGTEEAQTNLGGLGWGK